MMPISDPNQRREPPPWSSHRPVIGITLDSETGAAGKYSKFDFYALRENYSGAVAAQGGIPLPLPHEPKLVADYLALIDGLVITGGAFDVDPTWFGATSRHATVVTKDRRSQFELAMLQGALAADLPILGICGGEQLLTVALGGTLIQHIPDEVPQALAHEQPNPRDQPGHVVALTPGTRLYEWAAAVGIVDKHAVAVNSAHHQAVKTLPPGVIVNAVAPDGVIEGFEVPGRLYCFGIEWHPEFFITDLDRAIFTELIAHAANYRNHK
ncbi:MAG: gamma-glutamyl-gamma-aminobutyrate hydrolase family protein [Candidatus Symbiobacter sp.]|nr:gamma-glutamyl-gamma-aminobutyrate hydrolase family protein [Candidatus Symbiobacter sp.]